MWHIIEVEGDWPHVIPYQDLKPHETTRDCWCRPIDDYGVVVHNSMDRREEHERKDATLN